MDVDAQPNRQRSMSIELERDALRRGSLEITLERSRTLNTEKFYNGALVCEWLLSLFDIAHILLLSLRYLDRLISYMQYVVREPMAAQICKSNMSRVSASERFSTLKALVPPMHLILADLPSSSDPIQWLE